MITISIPVKAHIKKYLLKKYGSLHKVSKKSFIGLLVLELLNTKIEQPDRNFLNQDKYELIIPEYYFNTKGFNLNQNKTKFLGVCLEKLFFEDFYSFVDMELIKGTGNAYQSTALFLKVFDISENEIKLESMYRNYQRYSHENIKQKKQVLIVKQ